MERYDRNPGLRVPHRVSPATEPADDWIFLIRDARLENRIEVEEGKEPEGELKEAVVSVGNLEYGTSHVVVKR